MTQEIVSPAKYLAVYVALAVLLALTVVAAQFHFGPFNLVIAMSIAVAKTLLVILYFMHVRYSTPLTRVFAFVGFLWLTILLALLFSDPVSRGWLTPEETHPAGTTQDTGPAEAFADLEAYAPQRTAPAASRRAHKPRPSSRANASASRKRRFIAAE